MVKRQLQSPLNSCLSRKALPQAKKRLDFQLGAALRRELTVVFACRGIV